MKRIFFCLLNCVFFYVSCSTENNKEYRSFSGYRTDKLSEVSFNEKVYDFGRIKDDSAVYHAFRFVNNGNSDLVVSSVTIHCGCTLVDRPEKKIPPNGIDSILVKFNPKLTFGLQERVVEVVMNTKPDLHTLTIRAEVQTARP